METLKMFLTIVLTLATMLYVISQARKPDPWVGRFMLNMMNISHSGFTDWGLQHVRIARDFTILDVGCGGGRTIQKMASITITGKVYGIDYAAGGVAASQAANAALIKTGRVEIQKASVSRLPFPDNFFDLVTAIETHYYWPNPVSDLREIRRVLKPGAALMIVAENYKGGRNDYYQRPVMRLLGAIHLNVDEHRALFSAADFAGVQVFEESKQGWICVVGIKPA